MNKLKILILDDSQRIVFELKVFLEECDYIVYESLSPSQAFEILDKNEIDIMILDIKLPEMDGLEVLKRVKSQFPDIEVIMVTGHGDIEKVIQAMRLGAFDFFNKPFRLVDIQNAIERTKKYVFLNNKLKTVENNYALVSKELRDKTGHHIAGRSKAIKSVLELMYKVAETDTTSVLITGESGTGKELVARGIHSLSKRKDNYFYAANCSAIPADLFESELFGHVKGAFTGATEDKTGWFEMAHKGTLFLDEIGDMPIPFQTKLLRVFEDKKVRRVGSNKEFVTDVRILSATNKNIKKMIEKHSFRSDLYHRFNTFQIHIPPLRERVKDISLLLEYYTEFFSKALNRKIEKIEPRLIEKLKQYHFPGNVRELKNLVERAIILCDNGVLKEDDFPVLKNGAHALQCETTDCAYLNISSKDRFNLPLIEETVVRAALKNAGNNKTKASKLLNITWHALDRRMKKYGVGK
ncbi:MAG: sigma-54-dependent Fis family transcriptional regulator [Desulfobacterales bacterium]|nr:sigma-54-dependent Fis family transcriptional regulator [Desulfobacterales bacterium]